MGTTAQTSRSFPATWLPVAVPPSGPLRELRRLAFPMGTERGNNCRKHTVCHLGISVQEPGEERRVNNSYSKNTGIWDSGGLVTCHREPVAENGATVGRQDAFGMELNAVDIVVAVTECHNLAFATL